jgi:hypothetical protein
LPLKLPFQNNIVIEDSKIKNYLLNTKHPFGITKAEFFLSHNCNVKSLKNILLKQAMEVDFISKVKTDFGTKYLIESIVLMPDSNTVLLRSVWIVVNEDNFVKFVTAYPIK